jgi:hypothetical protein
MDMVGMKIQKSGDNCIMSSCTNSASDISGGIGSRRRRWMEHVVRMREMRNVLKILAGEPEWKKHRSTKVGFNIWAVNTRNNLDQYTDRLCG